MAFLTIACIIFKPIHGILYQGLIPAYGPIPLPLPLLDSINHHHLLQSTTGQSSSIFPNDFDQTIDKFKSYNFSPSSLFRNPLNSAIFYANTYRPIGSVKPPNDLYTYDLSPYYHNGRYLKQYLVMEDNLDDNNSLDNYLSRFVPYVPTATSRGPNFGFSTEPNQAKNLQTNTVYSIPTAASPLPIQLGSGSLGYIRLPNGAVYLGSGSLGYINDIQKANEQEHVRNRQSPGASTLTFGETPK